MSGGEFENLKKAAEKDDTKAAPQEASFDPFLEERSFKAPEKAEAAKTDDKVEHKKEAFQEGKESYSDYLARTNTPEQNFEALKKHLEACCNKIAQLKDAGFSEAGHDVTAGGSFLGGVVRDNSPEGVKKFLDSIGEALKQKGN